MEQPTRVRWNLYILFFIIALIAFFDRIDLSIAAPMMMQEFNIDKIQFGLLMTVFSIAYALIQIPGGMMAETFGPKKVISVSLAWWSIFTILTVCVPTYALLVIVRFLFGLGEGPLWPATNYFIGRWYGKYEKAKANSALLAGSYCGAAIGPTLTVAIILALGWRSVFVIYGVIGFILLAIWHYYAQNVPEEHKDVNLAELSIIREGVDVKDEISEKPKKTTAPWKNYLSSIQFWTLGGQYFITLYIFTFFLAWLPMYLMEARNFSLKEMGFVASIPFVAILLLVLTTGFYSDYLARKGKRKIVSRSALAVVGLALSGIGIYMAAKSILPAVNVFWLTVGLGTLGMTLNVSWATCNDLGVKYSGSVSGWMNLWGNLGAAASPLCSAILVTRFGWDACLILTSFLAIAGVILWLGVNPDRALRSE